MDKGELSFFMLWAAVTPSATLLTNCSILAIFAGRLSDGRNLYISRASGDDRWSCDQSKPCKTIWRAVTLASRGDHIHLDGTNTDKDPYTCQSGTSEHPGVYINKSLTLTGFGISLSQIRCTVGTSLTFNGSDDEQPMEVTLSGLLVKESFVSFQDSSAQIDGCKFEGSKRGVEFVIRAQSVSSIQIRNSTFSRNKNCISLIVNITTSPLHSIKVVFKLTNSSFDDNALSDEGNGISFAQSPYRSVTSNRSVSCDVTLKNATFSRNTFGRSGLVFMEMKNGNQNIHLQDVTFFDNSPSSSGSAFMGEGDNSECIVHSAAVNILIDSSNFTSQTARSFSVRVSNISLKIYNSSFRGHRVEGNGGVISMKGTDLCKINVSHSSFVNTTSAQGGAINIECTNVDSLLQHSTFTKCTALRQGGAVFMDTGPKSPKRKEDKDLVLFLESSRFVGCRSGNGGALIVLYKTQIKITINKTHFASNYAYYGGAISIILNSNIDALLRTNGNHITIEHSTFLNNHASGGGGAICLSVNNPSILILQRVIMEANVGENLPLAVGAGVFVVYTISTVKIRQSRFLMNEGIVFVLKGVEFLELKDSLFDGNYAGSFSPYGGALYIDCGPVTTSISIMNTTFNNCSGRRRGGAINLNHAGNLTLFLKNSRFVENFVSRDIFAYGGAIFLSLARDTVKSPGCIQEGPISANQVGDTKEFPSWDYNRQVIFEDTTFERNAGYAGGAVYLSNGKATFRNCYFIDNFAASLGGHIYTVAGSASLIIQNCIFHQTVKKLQFLYLNYSKSSFIHAESSGALKVYNSTMYARPYGTTRPLVLVTTGRLVDLGNNNWTTFYCPVGSQMEITYFSNLITTQVNNTPCKINVSTIEFSCSTCAGNSYSLQRGRSLGSTLAPGFQCLQCPFGADCSQNILAKPNFWGFKETVNPPMLTFTMCPLGYCSPPQKTDFPEYNACQGNRTGELCGHCNDSYTETLYSSNCIPSHECHDYWFWPVALLYVSLMALYFTFKPPIVPWIKRQILWFKRHETENQDNNFDKGYLKIIFYFYQAANLLLVYNSSQFLIKTKLIEPLVGLFNFHPKSSSGLICLFPGLTVVTKQLFSASHVFGTLLMICAFYSLHWGIQKFRGQRSPSVGPYIGGGLQTVLL